MGHSAGWLALESGLASGADVILIPELPYDLKVVQEFLMERRRSGRRFSIIALAEGALSRQDADKAVVNSTKKNGRENGSAGGFSTLDELEKQMEPDNGDKDSTLIVQRVEGEERSFHIVEEPIASRVARQLQELTGTEARVTSLGHVQRGGIPSAFDRSLCTLLGAKAGQLLAEGTFNVMVAFRNHECIPIPLEETAGKKKTVPPDHPLIDAARQVGTCLGTEEDAI